MATQDTVGNLLEVLDGPTGEVFVDDRADMFPEPVFRDEVALIRGRPQWATILDRYDVDVVIWSSVEAAGFAAGRPTRSGGPSSATRRGRCRAGGRRACATASVPDQTPEMLLPVLLNESDVEVPK